MKLKDFFKLVEDKHEPESIDPEDDELYDYPGEPNDA